MNLSSHNETDRA